MPELHENGWTLKVVEDEKVGPVDITDIQKASGPEIVVSETRRTVGEMLRLNCLFFVEEPTEGAHVLQILSPSSAPRRLRN